MRLALKNKVRPSRIVQSSCGDAFQANNYFETNHKMSRKAVSCYKITPNYVKLYSCVHEPRDRKLLAGTWSFAYESGRHWAAEVDKGQIFDQSWFRCIFPPSLGHTLKCFCRATLRKPILVWNGSSWALRASSHWRSAAFFGTYPIDRFPDRQIPKSN